MPVYKDSNANTWYVKVMYTDYTGQHKRKTKCGFKTKREASHWEDEFKLSSSGSLDMSFSDFVKIYRKNQGTRIKETTDQTKDNIISTKIIPYFGDKKVTEITATDIIAWQNVMMKAINPLTGKPYSKVYLKTIHNQLSAIFNHAVRFYGLKENPARLAGCMGTEKCQEMSFWTKEEYVKFSEAVMKVPAYYYAFEVLYWCGLREGELLALTKEDIDLKKKQIYITKTFAHIKGKDYIGDPKTPKSKRIVSMPDFLVSELSDYIQSLYDLKSSDRLFSFSKTSLSKTLKKYAGIAGVKAIRVHDLRHSHVSLLINMGYSAVAIATRVGHESSDITYRYAHLFPTVQEDMANSLNELCEKGGER